MTVRWQPPGYPGDRMLMMSGTLACGAVFPPLHGGRYWRWRAWVTPNINPCEGSARTEAEAKGLVEALFRDFLHMARLKHDDQS